MNEPAGPEIRASQTVRPDVRHGRAFALVIFAALSFGPLDSVAAQSDQPPRSAASNLCFRPKSPRECENFVFLDAVGALPVLPSTHTLFPGRTVRDLAPFGGASVGFMHSASDASSIGLSIDGAVSGVGDGRVAVKAHWRRWYQTGSMDVSAGPLAGDVTVLYPLSGCATCEARRRTHGATAEVSLIERHGVGLMLGADVAKTGDRLSRDVHAGARLEAYPALAVAILTGIGFVVVFATLARVAD